MYLAGRDYIVVNQLQIAYMRLKIELQLKWHKIHILIKELLYIGMLLNSLDE